MENAKVPTRRPVKTLEQANAMLTEIGRVQAQIERLKNSLEVGVAALRLDHDQQLAPLQVDMQRMTELLRGWCEENRHTLLKGKAKTIKLTAGDAGWRKATSRLVVGEGVDLLSLLKAGRGLKRFIRTKEEPDMVALVKEPKVVETLQGVAISEAEDAFFVKPSVLTLQPPAAGN